MTPTTKRTNTSSRILYTKGKASLQLELIVQATNQYTSKKIGNKMKNGREA
jgi:hypothetical protein